MHLSPWKPRPKRSSLLPILIVVLFLASMISFLLAVSLAAQAERERREFEDTLASMPPVRPLLGPMAPMTASWYGPRYHGRLTASGERFDRAAMTCAHRTLPFGTVLLVEHAGREVLVRVTDRGPLAWTGHDLDLSEAAFARLAPTTAGVLQVQAREVIP